MSVVLLELHKKLKAIIDERFKPPKKARFQKKNIKYNVNMSAPLDKAFSDPLLAHDEEAFKKNQYDRILQSKLRMLEN